MNQAKAYVVTLTVEDNAGDIDIDSLSVTVVPLKKAVEVTHQPAIPIPNEQVFARMSVSYNWIYEDTYVVSKIHYESGGFLGIGVISIWDAHSHKIPLPIWSADIPSFWHERTYYPKSDKILYGGDTFEGIKVDAFDAMNIYVIGWAGMSFSTVLIPAPFFETSSACFQPDFTEAPDLPIEKQDWSFANLFSPGELRIYDSEGRVTGLVSGEVKKEIPNSMYDKESKTVIIFSPSDTYRYEVVGTDEGKYGLTIASVKDGKATDFTATDIPILDNAIHQYTIDWDILSEGEEGVSVQIDSDDDGTFERTIGTGETFTADDYSSSVQLKGKYLVTWGFLKQTMLFQNYPNPFNPETWIPFRLAKQAEVSINIYDATGRIIRTIRLGELSAGIYTSKDKAAHWDGRDSFGERVPSGVYFYQIIAGDFTATRKLVVLK